MENNIQEVLISQAQIEERVSQMAGSCPGSMPGKTRCLWACSKAWSCSLRTW